MEQPNNTEVPAVEEKVETLETPPSSAPPVLGMNDIRTMLGIINVASEAGAFKGGQLATVGNMYNKLDSFIKWTEENAITSNETADGTDTAATQGEE